MGTETARERGVAAPFAATWSPRGGAFAGLVATTVMGIAITLGDLSVVREAIAGLYAMEGSLVVGWVAHLVHGMLFGLLFALVLSDPGLYRVSEWPWKTVLAGVVYGLVLALAGAGVVMPIWLGVVGFADPPAVPHVTAPLVAWHLLYGAVLGATFALVDGRDLSASSVAPDA